MCRNRQVATPERDLRPQRAYDIMKIEISDLTDSREPTDSLMSTPPPSPRAAHVLRRRSGRVFATLLGLLAAGALGTALLPAAASAAAKSPGRVTFGVEPASASGPDGRPDLSYSVTPGATLFDHVAVLNYSSVALALQLYATDAVETATGGFGLLPGDERPRAAGSWITLPPADKLVVVPPARGGTPGDVVVPITVRIPDTATPGDHAGGIVAALRTEGRNASGQRVLLVQRTGTRLFVQVAGTLRARLAVDDLQTSYSGTLDPIGAGSLEVTYLVRNDGNVDLGVAQSVRLSGLVGDEQRAPVAKIALLLPGSSVRERVTLRDVWPVVRLHTTVTADPLSSGVAGLGALTPVSATASAWAIPWALVVLVLLLVALGIGGDRWRRSRRANRTAAAKGGRP